MAAIANAEMAAVWDGEEGDEWTENADRYDATDRFIARRFEAETEVGRSDRIVDIGCGTGKSSRDVARRATEGSVLGVDLSSRMLADARRRNALEGVTNVDFVQADAQVHPFEAGAYDLAISVFGAMFFADPLAAFINIGRGLRPGGKLRSSRGSGSRTTSGSRRSSTASQPGETSIHRPRARLAVRTRRRRYGYHPAA